MDNCGIYCIYFVDIDNKYYVGCSTNLQKRVLEHKNALKNNRHKNAHLQNAYNKYGEPVIEVLETCEVDNLFEREIFYIKEFDSYKSGFNRTTGGEGGGFGEGNSSAKYTEEDYLAVLRALAYTNDPFSRVSNYTGVSVDTIKHISRLDSHGYLEGLDPEAYAIVKSKHNNRDNSAATKGISYPEIVSPDGLVFNVTNVHKFAEEHGLQYQNLHKVLIGKRISHKGWKLNGSNNQIPR